MHDHNDAPALELIIWSLFRKGHDTIEIGRRVGCSEAIASMHLSRAFDRLHAMKKSNRRKVQA